ncbi:signal peptidase II [uncultured Paracoccus sp.]|uniref:signal peptidase II n=2 Tax=Paracoccus TaxID=265 RepID=UPI00344C0408
MPAEVPAPKPAPKPRKPRAKKAPAPPPVSLRAMAWVAGLILLLDQVSKYYVVHVMRLDRLREIELLPPWLNLHMAWNQGVNFGLLSSSQDIMRWVLIAVAVAVCVWVILWIRRVRPGWFAQASAGLLVGGAIGNVIDRVLYGAVADFLNMSLPIWRNPYSFNVADIAIFAGAIGLILQPPQSADKARDLATK